MTATVGSSVTHRRYVPHGHAHYAGNLVDGAYVLGLFGDTATELSIRSDGDEGLLAGYETIEFLAPVRGGDTLEVTATLDRVGRRSRGVAFRAVVVCRATPDAPKGTGSVLEPPLLVARGRGTVVVPSGG